MGIGVTTVTAEQETTGNSWAGFFGYSPVSNGTVLLKLSIMARRANNEDCAAWEIRSLLKRDGSGNLTAVLAGVIDHVVTPIKTLGALLWDVRVTLDAGDFNVEVKGASGNTVGWYANGTAEILNYPEE